METNRIYLTFIDSEKYLSVSPTETVLTALIDNDIPIKQACTNGACGICLTPLLAGEIDYAEKTPRGLNQKEKQGSYFLPCIATCKTDIYIGHPKVPLR
ncbi:ferredoxin [Marinomonas ushuaiensis DSM 15871]|uniref:Ferredoxin n=1 Tax=Marinomonas ushuaiensis DSM 15871 TaxID=1122207 RepID=X7E373_9GAMM|nr:2Fe-2S iron-sulfur cluster-binding protein [Marinomonas ushuaiensis]ETX09628.1 ferredoxin [Marinomonas ushuaiensis DSM 15871]